MASQSDLFSPPPHTIPTLLVTIHHHQSCCPYFLQRRWRNSAHIRRPPPSLARQPQPSSKLTPTNQHKKSIVEGTTFPWPTTALQRCPRSSPGIPVQLSTFISFPRSLLELQSGPHPVFPQTNINITHMSTQSNPTQSYSSCLHFVVGRWNRICSSICSSIRIHRPSVGREVVCSTIRFVSFRLLRNCSSHLALGKNGKNSVEGRADTLIYTSTYLT